MGVITSITLTNAGEYTSPPTGITITNGGSGVNLTYSLNSTTVSSTFTFTNGGTGYLTGSIITFTGGVYTTQAYGTITAPSGAITAITLTSAGSGYKSPPTGFTIKVPGSGSVIDYSLVATSISGFWINDNKRRL